MVTSPVPAPSSITFLSARLYLSLLVSKKWHSTIACLETQEFKFYCDISSTWSSTNNKSILLHRGPEDGSVEICGLFDPDLLVWESVAFPGLWADDGGMEPMSHYGLGQVCIYRSSRRVEHFRVHVGENVSLLPLCARPNALGTTAPIPKRSPIQPLVATDG